MILSYPFLQNILNELVHRDIVMHWFDVSLCAHLQNPSTPAVEHHVHEAKSDKKQAFYVWVKQG